ncbi:hypothetical protein EB796_005304 [Bugula neritina]|uniref:Uncharacterized protein n=1 Tax=Bugula neritina TaxID=10212 RepID=A0A7J7KFH4_BUGNE|nr:hypothetical protein EB796_005304 [Bugula neritina]
MNEADCNTECLHISYRVNCTSGEVHSNRTAHGRTILESRRPLDGRMYATGDSVTITSSSAETLSPHTIKGSSAPSTTSSTTTTLTTTTPTTATTTPTTATTTPTTTAPNKTTPATATTTTTTPNTTTTTPNTTTTTPNTTTTTPNTTTTTPTTTISNKTTPATATTTTTTPNMTTTTTTTPTTTTETTTTPSTTTESTSTTTRPEIYISCSCLDGKLYSVEGEKREVLEGSCVAACPHWSSTTDYCFCGKKAVLQYAKSCVEGEGQDYILDGPYICKVGEIESTISNETCECPEIVKVDQCDCHSGYGRIGEECHYHHLRPIEGVCSENNVNPYVCESKCSQYSDWKSWSTCAPCGIGNENGTYTRTRSCVFPDVFDYTTDYMGSEVCTTNETVTTECSCGYIWSEWGSCDCSSDKQERNRCAAKISEVTPTTMVTSTHADKNTNDSISNTTSDIQEETTPDPGELIGLATSESLVTDDRMYCYLLANILY